jgi:hypothetical protein
MLCTLRPSAHAKTSFEALKMPLIARIPAGAPLILQSFQSFAGHDYLMNENDCALPSIKKEEHLLHFNAAHSVLLGRALFDRRHPMNTSRWHEERMMPPHATTVPELELKELVEISAVCIAQTQSYERRLAYRGYRRFFSSNAFKGMTQGGRRAVTNPAAHCRFVAK